MTENYTSRRTLTGLAAPKPKSHAPDSVTEELIRAASAPRSLTAAVFGDPLPGRSALDKLKRPSNLSEPRPISAVVKAGLFS